MDYIDLVKNVALLKTALHFIDNDEDEVKTFKSEVGEVIKDYEKQMDDYDRWLSMKEEEARNNVD